jgi:hypothetical protein
MWYVAGGTIYSLQPTVKEGHMPKSTKKKQPTALELFERYYKKYREVKLRWGGISVQKDHHTYSFTVGRREQFWTTGDSYLDLKKNGFDLAITYSSKSEVGLHRQIHRAIRAAILAGPFSGRTFYLDPDLEKVALSFRQLVARQRHSLTKIPMTFLHDGEPIEGLYLMQNLEAERWDFFIPYDSPEGVAITRALEVEQAEASEARRRAEQPIDMHTRSITSAPEQNSAKAGEDQPPPLFLYLLYSP